MCVSAFKTFLAFRTMYNLLANHKSSNMSVGVRGGGLGDCRGGSASCQDLIEINKTLVYHVHSWLLLWAVLEIFKDFKGALQDWVWLTCYSGVNQTWWSPVRCMSYFLFLQSVLILAQRLKQSANVDEFSTWKSSSSLSKVWMSDWINYTQAGQGLFTGPGIDQSNIIEQFR